MRMEGDVEMVSGYTQLLTVIWNDNVEAIEV